MEKILVTGGTGTVGSVVSGYLASQKIPFRMLARDPEKARSLVRDRATIVQGDYGDKAALRTAMEGVETLFLLCPGSPDKDKQEIGLVDAAKEAGVRYIVKLSAMGSSPDSSIMLARQHAKVEKAIEGSGMAYTFLRPHAFMQNTLASAFTVKNESKIYSSLGQAGIPMIDARDIGEVAARILVEPGEYEGKAVNLTGEKLVTFADIASTMSKLLDREILYMAISGEDFIKAATGMGMPGWLCKELAAMNERWAEGKDIELSPAAQEVLNRSPRTYGEFLADYLKAFQ